MINRNGMIDFMRFVFCILIVLDHATLFRGRMLAGYIGVEFFFIVSGWLLMRHVEQKFVLGGVRPNFLKDTLHKVMGFYPEFLIGVIMAAFFLQKYGEPVGIGSCFLGMFNSLMLLQTFGFSVTLGIGVSWYLSVMIGMYLLLSWLAYKFKQDFINVFIPLIVLFIYGGMSMKYHTVAVVYQSTMDSFILIGMLRGFAGMGLGMLLYEGSSWLKKVRFTQFGKNVITGIEIFGYVLCICISIIINSISDWDFIMIALISMSVMISFSEVSLTSTFFNKKIYYILGRVSLNIFLNHHFIALIIAVNMLEDSVHTKMMYYFCGIIICSIINYCVANWLRDNLSRIKLLILEK